MTVNADEKFVNAKVTYTLALDGKIIVVENVPARVSLDTGEQHFSPDTVEQLHKIIKSGRSPDKVVSASVFEFAA